MAINFIESGDMATNFYTFEWGKGGWTDKWPFWLQNSSILATKSINFVLSPPRKHPKFGPKLWIWPQTPDEGEGKSTEICIKFAYFLHTADDLDRNSRKSLSIFSTIAEQKFASAEY